MSMMDNAVEDAVGERSIADLLMPLVDGQLRSENERACLVAVFADLPELAPLRFGERRRNRYLPRIHCLEA